ncbi:hypothetical protein AMECASPLE_035767, partial [Ameca splendens]
MDFPALPCPRRILHWLLLSGQTTLLLPPDQPSLPNLWIRMPKSASSFMTSLLCPDPRFKPVPSDTNVPPDLSICTFVLEQSLSVRALQEMLANTEEKTEG